MLSNWHENIELLCFIEGEGTVYSGENSYHVAVGDIAIINSNLLHRIDGKMRYHCLIVDRAFCDQNGIPILSLHFRELIKNEALFEHFLQIAKEFGNARSENPEPYVAASVRQLVLSLLIELCRSHAMSNEAEKRSRSADAHVKSALSFLRLNFERSLTLDEIAESIGISKYHLSREFRQLTNTTIFESLNIIRCKEARRMLSNRLTVSEAATACGFENLSYFSKTFKKYTGKLPSAYTKQKK